MKTIEQQNAMIAEFMGCTFEHKKTDKSQVKVVNGLLDFIPDWRYKIGVAICGTPYLPVKQLKFHTSWDWLIPVIEKIEKLNYDFEILGGCWVIIKDVDPNRDESTEIIEVSSETKMQTVYNAVCQFIEWYNANK